MKYLFGIQALLYRVNCYFIKNSKWKKSVIKVICLAFWHGRTGMQYVATKRSKILADFEFEAKERMKALAHESAIILNQEIGKIQRDGSRILSVKKLWIQYRSWQLHRMRGFSPKWILLCNILHASWTLPETGTNHLNLSRAAILMQVQKNMEKGKNK